MAPACDASVLSYAIRARTLFVLAVRILPLTAVALAGVAGCATLGDGTRWGEQAKFRVGWERTTDAALRAVKNPAVWAPLVGAAVFQIDNWDHQVSNWAVDNTPLFGSAREARNVSDDLMAVAGVGYLASLLATPSGDAGPEWWSAKMSGGLVGLGAITATALATEGLKISVNRVRPDGDDYSFPSGHTSFAAVTDTMTVQNLAVTPMSHTLRTSLTVGADALTAATAWARVEAGAHYPSDVLVGMSIGNFFGKMFDDAFLSPETSRRFSLSFEPARGGGELVWNWRF